MNPVVITVVDASPRPPVIQVVDGETGAVEVIDNAPNPKVIQIEVEPPRGLPGTNGLPAYTFTAADYVQPALGATVTVAVLSSAWCAAGAPVYSTAGRYTVTAAPDATHVTLRLDAAGVAAVGSTVSAGVLLTPSGVAGVAGVAGAAGAAGADGIARAWSSTTPYGATVTALRSDGVLVRSLQGGNIGHDPATAPDAWWTYAQAEPRAVGSASTVTAPVGHAIKVVGRDAQGRITTVTEQAYEAEVALVWRPGGVTAGNVFATESEVITAFQATTASTRVTIRIDFNGRTRAEWIALGGYLVITQTVDWEGRMCCRICPTGNVIGIRTAAGVQWQGVAEIEFDSHGNYWYWYFDATIAPFIVASPKVCDNNSGQATPQLHFRAKGVNFYPWAGTQPFIQCAYGLGPYGNAGVTTLTFEDAGFYRGGSLYAYIDTNNSTIFLNVEDGAYTRVSNHTTFLRGAGTLWVDYKNNDYGSPAIDTSSSGFTGTLNFVPPEYGGIAYNPNVSYRVDDLCSYGGIVYRCIVAGKNHQPDTSPTYWTPALATPIDASVTAAKIAANAVTAAKIATATITNTEISASAAIALSKLASLPALAVRQILAGAGLTGGGDLGSDRTLALATTGPGAGTYGSASAPPSGVVLDAYGRTTSVTTTAIGGDLSGSLGALSVDKIKGASLPATPVSSDEGRQLLVSGASSWAYGRYREYVRTFTISGAVGVVGPTSLITLPTRFKLAESWMILTTAVAGAGSTATVRLGSTSGGQEILLDWAIVVGTTTQYTLWGDQPAAERGTDMAAGRGFGAYYSSATQMYARSTISGAAMSAGQVTLILVGWDLT